MTVWPDAGIFGKAFDESQHPRAADGKFGEGGEQTDPHAGHVAAMMDALEKAKDRETFSRADIGKYMETLRPLSPADLRTVAEGAGLKVEKRASRPAILTQIHRMLDAGHRAYESIEA
jgi:hypothetical protein